jgi:hypothetical protein
MPAEILLRKVPLIQLTPIGPDPMGLETVPP